MATPATPTIPAAPAPAATTATPAAAAAAAAAKLKVHFIAAGSAPILRKTKFQMAPDERFASLQLFLRKMLKADALFLYCGSSFCPGPNAKLADLHDAFAKRGELVVHYSLQEAWG